MIEVSCQKDRKGSEALVMRLGAKVGRQGHLRDVELEVAHHSTEDHRHRGNLRMLHLEHGRADAAVLQGDCVPIVRYRSVQYQIRHAIILRRLSSVSVRHPLN